MSSINRKPHILKPEKSLAMPRHMIFFDTETKQVETPEGHVKQVLRLGWAVYYRKSYGRHAERNDWKLFFSEDEFWQFVSQYLHPKTRVWIIARNVTFDFTVVKGWTHLRQLGYKLKFFHNKGTCNIISVRNKSSSIVFLDSMNWFVESLEKTGQRIGLPKLKIDFETCSEKELIDYCHRDVEIELENFKIFIRFLEANHIARLCYTKGSTAMAAFLLRHYTTKIYIHNNEQAINLERQSYKGGRVECFFIGELKNEPYYFVDVNSLYPFVMRDNLYPVKYLSIINNASVTSLRKFTNSKMVVAKVRIKTPLPIYGVKRERLVFPTGNYWTTLTTPEIIHALKRKYIKEVSTIVTYDGDRIFKTYVDTFYAMRMKFKSAGEAEYEELCKKFLNTLYGKFGQKGENWQKIGDCPNEPDREELVFNMNGRRVSKMRYLLGEVFIQTGVGECFDSFPAIAAHVTAYGRMYLWSLMEKAGHGNYYYCDTDSLLVNEAGLCNLKDITDQRELGFLKIDEQTSNVTIRGLKDYTTQSKVVTKGVRKTAVRITENVYSQEQWSSFRGLLRSGQPESYVVKNVTKHLKRDYRKGNVTKTGFVEPYVYNDSALTAV